MKTHYPGISAKFRLDDADKMRATMTISMTVGQWREIMGALSSDRYEEWPLRAAIRDLIMEADKTFSYRSDAE